jgi:hypothetical protein
LQDNFGGKVQVITATGKIISKSRGLRWWHAPCGDLFHQCVLFGACLKDGHADDPSSTSVIVLLSCYMQTLNVAAEGGILLVFWHTIRLAIGATAEKQKSKKKDAVLHLVPPYDNSICPSDYPNSSPDKRNDIRDCPVPHLSHHARYRSPLPVSISTPRNVTSAPLAKRRRLILSWR